MRDVVWVLDGSAQTRFQSTHQPSLDIACAQLESDLPQFLCQQTTTFHHRQRRRDPETTLTSSLEFSHTDFIDAAATNELFLDTEDRFI